MGWILLIAVGQVVTEPEPEKALDNTLIYETPEYQAAIARADFERASGNPSYKYLTGIGYDNEKRLERLLNFWLNSLSTSPRINPIRRIGPKLWRINIEDYRWGDAAWDAVSKLDPYYQSTDNRSLVRADWLLYATSNSQEERYGNAYYLLLYGTNPTTLDHFFSRWAIDRKRIYKYFKGTVVIDSSVTVHNRILMRFDDVLGSLHQTFDTTNAVDLQDLVTNNLKFEFENSELIGQLPNGLSHYYVVNSEEARIDAADPAVAADSASASVDSRVRVPRSCVSCHGAASGYHIPVNHLAERRAAGIPTIYNNRRQRDGVEARFVADHTRHYERDAEDYESVVNTTTGWTAAETASIYDEFLSWYEGTVGLSQAAREIGTDEETARRIFLSSGITNLESLAGGLTIARDTWEISTFSKAYQLRREEDAITYDDSGVILDERDLLKRNGDVRERGVQPPVVSPGVRGTGSG